MIQSIDALLLLVYLMPGFIGMLVFESLAEIKRRQSPEKIGLIVFFTIISILSISIIHPVSLVPDFDELKKNPGLLSDLVKSNVLQSSVAAALFGVVFSTIANYRIIYIVASFLKLTKRTGSIDPWHQVFSKHRRVWIQIRFEDGSILVGWPKYYSEEGEVREVFLAKATWHFPVKNDESGEKAGGVIDIIYRDAEVNGDGVLISNFSKVKSIEILKGENNVG